MGNADTDRRATHFYLLRHAPTEWNAAGRIQGQADSPLTQAGREQAAGWGVRLAALDLAHLLSSDAGRALATAEAINVALKRPLSTDRRLREQDWGRWTGCRHRSLKKDAAPAYIRQQARGWHFRPPGGENHLEVLERALAALEDAAAEPGENVLVVTHEGVIKCLVYHLAIRDGCGCRPAPPESGHLHRLVRVGTRIWLHRVNAVDLNA